MPKVLTKKTILSAPVGKPLIAIRSIGLVNLLTEIRGSTFITIMTKTVPDMKLKGNPYRGNCFKIATLNGQVNFFYDEAVLRRLEKEGKDSSSFHKGESWHEAVCRPDGTLTPLCRHKETGEYYLRFRCIQNVSEARYITAKGKRCNMRKLKPFLRPASTYENQGCDDPIRILVYKLENILQITINGISYQLI